MSTLTVSSQLEIEEEKYGIIVFRNAELPGAHYFAFANDDETLISLPDGTRVFRSIKLHPHVVVCHNFSIDDNELPYHVYLVATKEWLANPIPDKTGFHRIVSIEPEYLHLHCADTDYGRVFAFENKKWLEVDVGDGSYHNIDNQFTGVKVCTFQDRPSLELSQEKNSPYNPVSIFLIDTGEFFSIPIPPNKYTPDGARYMTFNKIFPRYILIAFGDGITSFGLKFFLVWRIREQNYFSFEQANHAERPTTSFDRDMTFVPNSFTEKHIAVQVRKDEYAVISTETWEPVELEFTYTVKTKSFRIATLPPDGVMTASISPPELLSIAVKE